MQGVFADTFLKLFEDSDEPTLMAALQSFQQVGLHLTDFMMLNLMRSLFDFIVFNIHWQAGPHLAGILPSLTARSLCNALVGIVSAKVWLG